jgi:hypothetical protein
LLGYPTGLKFRPVLASADGWKSYSRTDDPPPMVGWLDAHGARLSPEAASSSRVHIYLKISAAQVPCPHRLGRVRPRLHGACLFVCFVCFVCLFCLLVLFVCLFVCFVCLFLLAGRALRRAATRA